MERASLRCLALLALLLGACGDSRDAPPAPPRSASLPGVWVGVFPCDDCPGIDVTLWLRADERFFIEQHYRPGDSSGTPATAYGLGRWRWDAGGRVLVLDGEGPDRIFEPDGADALRMRTPSPLEHRLRRNADSPAFGATLRLSGTARREGDAYVFEECLTGYALPLDSGGDYARLRRHYRSVVPRGAAAPVELEGRFIWTADGAPASFRIERFITFRDEGGCTEPASPLT
jgi:uncharacterized lipoprotein NlpE involved in copper resistance